MTASLRWVQRGTTAPGTLTGPHGYGDKASGGFVNLDWFQFVR